LEEKSFVHRPVQRCDERSLWNFDLANWRVRFLSVFPEAALASGSAGLQRYVPCVGELHG
jgi:hypothetical protein